MSNVKLEHLLVDYLRLANKEFNSRKNFFYKYFISFFKRKKIEKIKKEIHNCQDNFNIKFKLKYTDYSYYINFYLTSMKNTKLKLHLVSDGNKIWVIDKKNTVILFVKKKGVIPFDKVSRLLISDIENYFNL
jgi:hypothetical protein